MPAPLEALSAALGRWNAGDLEGYLSLYDKESVGRRQRGIEAGLHSVQRER